jgi:hypothetical protein
MNSLLEQWHLHLGHQSIHTSISTELLLQKKPGSQGQIDRSRHADLSVKQC